MAVKLKHPITYKDGEKEVVVKEIIFTRFKAKHLKVLPPSLRKVLDGEIDTKDIDMDIAEILPLISALSGLPEEAVDEIDLIDDLEEVANELNSFFDQSPATSKN